MVCKQLEHVIAGYLRQVWDKSDWLYEGEHAFGPGHSYESQVINGMKIHPGNYKARRFMRVRVKNPLGYTLGDQIIRDASSCKYLGINLRSDIY